MKEFIPRWSWRQFGRRNSCQDGLGINSDEGIHAKAVFLRFLAIQFPPSEPNFFLSEHDFPPFTIDFLTSTVDFSPAELNFPPSDVNFPPSDLNFLTNRDDFFPNFINFHTSSVNFLTDRLNFSLYSTKSNKKTRLNRG